MDGELVPITVSAEQRAQLEAWIAGHKTPQSVAKRARIIQMAAEGLSNSEIARRTATSRPTVILWRERFASGGTAALSEVQPGARPQARCVGGEGEEDRRGDAA